MRNLTQYVHDHFDVSKSTLDLIDNICAYVREQSEYIDEGENLTVDGILFLSVLLDGVADMWHEEIKQAWRETK